MDYVKEIRDLILKCAKATVKLINKKEIAVYFLKKNQHPQDLPDDSIAVYCFLYKGEFLKIGQTNNNTRFKSHHYHMKSNRSTLAPSLIKDEELKLNNKDKENIKDWIINNCKRINIIFPYSHNKEDRYLLDFIEGLLHYKYNPRYERNFKNTNE